MDKELFAGEIYLIFEDRGIKEQPSKAWLLKLYSEIGELSDLDFAKGLRRINIISQEEWHKKYGFGGKPAISDWVDFFLKNKTQAPEKQVIIEVARILDYASFYLKNDVIFDNEFTNSTVKKYGGMSKIAWDIDKDNDSKRPREWVSKDLKEIWLACYDGNHGSYEKDIGRGLYKSIDYVGDKNRCLALMNKKEEAPINIASHEKVKEIYNNLSKKFKPTY